VAAVFISYRREDSAGYAGRLHEELEQRLGREQVFRDVDTLRAGQDFVNAIEQRLQQCGTLLAVIGRDWISPRLEQPDDYVALEIAAALQRPDVLVIPVLVGRATMPGASQLPERIRPLARRQAITLRDETWESDVDRLATLVRKPSNSPSPFADRRVVVGLAALAAAGLLYVLVSRGGVAPSTGAPVAATPAASSTAVPVTTSAYAVEIPTLPEVAHGDLTYTLISGSVSPRGNSNSVRFRVRVSNYGRYDANLWDASFRLAVGDNLLTPSGGLNEIVSGNSIEQAIVTFDVPPTTAKAALRIVGMSAPGDIPLDLSPSGRTPEPEDADAGDSLSRARMALMMSDPRPLLAGDGFSSTLVRVRSRHFRNKVRIIVGMRLANEGRYDISSAAVTLRLAHGGEVSAPVSEPSAVVAGGATYSGDWIFEVPPTTKHVELRASARDNSVNIPLEVR
jgi:hypothetical protein